MIRLKDIAAQAGVSVMTVSKALRDEPDVSAETKTRIKLLAQQMGYVPDSSAQGLRTRTSKLFGLALSSSADPFLARVVLAVEQGAYEMGYDVLLGNTLNIPEREDACLRRFMARRVDGIFIAPASRISPDARLYQELRSRNIPLVVIGPRPSYCQFFAGVEADELQAAAKITEHLLGLGHRRIAFLSGPTAAPWSRLQYDGYCRALRAAALEIDEKLVFKAGLTLESGASAAKQLLQERCNATAIQAINDLVAIGCAQTLASNGRRIPEDVSVAGVGNLPLTETMKWPLTTVNQPKYRLGTAAVGLMQQLLKRKTVESKSLPGELIIRGSTGIAHAV